MSYTPLNVDVFKAAFAGAAAGIGTAGRAPTITLATDPAVVNLVALAGAWAQAFDTAWGANPADGLQLTLIRQLSNDRWEGNYPSSLDPASYASQVAPLIAIVTAAETYFAGQGIVTAGAQLIAVNSSLQAVPSGATTVITGWTTSADPAGAFNPVTGLYTAPSSGFYQASASFLSSNAIPQNFNVFTDIQVNGVTKVRGVSNNAAAGGGNTNMAASVVGLVKVTKGDVIRIAITQFSGGNYTLFGFANDNNFDLAQVG